MNSISLDYNFYYLYTKGAMLDTLIPNWLISSLNPSVNDFAADFVIEYETVQGNVLIPSITEQTNVCFID